MKFLNFMKEILKFNIKNKILFIYNFLLIFSIFIGFRLENDIVCSSIFKFILNIICSIIISIFLTPMTETIFKKLKDSNKKRCIEFSKNDLKYYLLFIGILLLLWLPTFLAYYPGLFAYDVHYQIPQGYTTAYSTHHPIIHTLLLQLFYYNIGKNLCLNVNTGMALYTIFQMLILASALSYLILFLYRTKVKKKILIILLIFMGIFPVYSILSISMTKDIIFTAFFLVGLIDIAYVMISPDLINSKRIYLPYIFCIIMACLFRNNCVYSYILMIILLLPFLKKSVQIKKIIIFTTISVLIAIHCNYSFKILTDANDGSKNEMLSIPYQQIARVYNKKYNKLSVQEKKDILTILPDVNKYYCFSADNIKLNAYGLDNTKLFLKTYFKLLVKYPVEYCDAFLQTTIGYWYIFDTRNAEVYGVGLEGRQGYLLTDTKKGFNIEHKSYFPQLEKIYESLFSDNKYQNSTLLLLLCSMGVYFWMYIFVTFKAINEKNKKLILPLIYVGTYVFTLFFGPCSIIRYAFPYIVCLPCLINLLYNSEEKIEERKLLSK